MSENAWPKTTRQQVAWLQQRIGDWIDQAEAIGLSQAQVNELHSDLAEVGNHLNEAIRARSLAKSRTQRFHASARGLLARANGLIKIIRAHAILSGDPLVYERARIRPPASPSPVPPPGEPTAIRTLLRNNGSIQLTWMAVNASPGAGTAFIIYRKLAGEESYLPVGTTGVREFIDDTIPPGTISASYMIRGLRGDKLGPFGKPVTMYFGRVDGLMLAA